MTAETLHLCCTFFVVFSVFTLKQNNEIKLNCHRSSLTKLTNLTVAFIYHLDVRISCDSCVKLHSLFSFHTLALQVVIVQIYEKHQGFNFTELKTESQCSDGSLFSNFRPSDCKHGDVVVVYLMSGLLHSLVGMQVSWSPLTTIIFSVETLVRH